MHLWEKIKQIELELKEYQELVHSLQSKIVGVDSDAAFNERVGIFEAAQCAESKRVEQVELQLTETNRTLEEEKQLKAELLAKIDELERKQKADQAKIDEVKTFEFF
uniref:IF rod domain-containing protein n=1 Tax=Globodera pallida TaxID=36090 RepID=A0A183C2Z9_GLOPA